MLAPDRSSTYSYPSCSISSIVRERRLAPSSVDPSLISLPESKVHGSFLTKDEAIDLISGQAWVIDPISNQLIPPVAALTTKDAIQVAREYLTNVHGIVFKDTKLTVPVLESWSKAYQDAVGHTINTIGAKPPLATNDHTELNDGSPILEFVKLRIALTKASNTASIDGFPERLSTPFGLHVPKGTEQGSHDQVHSQNHKNGASRYLNELVKNKRVEFQPGEDSLIITQATVTFQGTPIHCGLPGAQTPTTMAGGQLLLVSEQFRREIEEGNNSRVISFYMGEMVPDNRRELLKPTEHVRRLGVEGATNGGTITRLRSKDNQSVGDKTDPNYYDNLIEIAGKFVDILLADVAKKTKLADSQEGKTSQGGIISVDVPKIQVHYADAMLIAEMIIDLVREIVPALVPALRFEAFLHSGGTAKLESVLNQSGTTLDDTNAEDVVTSYHALINNPEFHFAHRLLAERSQPGVLITNSPGERDLHWDSEINNWPLGKQTVPSVGSIPIFVRPPTPDPDKYSNVAFLPEDDQSKFFLSEDVTRVTNQLKSELNSEQPRPFAMVVGRVVRDKGFLEAVQQYNHTEDPEYNLVLVMNGNPEDEYYQEVQSAAAEGIDRGRIKIIQLPGDDLRIATQIIGASNYKNLSNDGNPELPFGIAVNFRDNEPFGLLPCENVAVGMPVVLGKNMGCEATINPRLRATGHRDWTMIDGGTSPLTDAVNEILGRKKEDPQSVINALNTPLVSNAPGMLSSEDEKREVTDLYGLPVNKNFKNPGHHSLDELEAVKNDLLAIFLLKNTDKWLKANLGGESNRQNNFRELRNFFKTELSSSIYCPDLIKALDEEYRTNLSQTAIPA